MTTLNQLRILVDDFPASFRFYRDVLGLAPQAEEQESGPYACFKLADGGTDIALFSRELMAKSLDGESAESAEPAESAETAETAETASRGGAGHAVLVFRVDDVDAAYAQAVAAGARSAAKPTDQPGWGMRVAHLRAPEGTLIEFCSY
jgi:predicted enzyme related to lactoylglutathione lyase